MTLVDVQTPLAEVVVHLHRQDSKVLVKIDVDGLSGIEFGVVVDNVALGLSQPVWTYHSATA